MGEKGLRRSLPAHIGIIMDGNGRWAQKQGLPRSEGHKQGAKVFRRICTYARDLGIPYLTFYAFSTENWQRPPEEVEALMNLFREYLVEAEDDPEEARGLQVRFIGDRAAIPADLVRLMEHAEKGSSGRGTTVNLAINYGGRAEILRSVQELARLAASGACIPEALTQEDIAAHLDTAGQPDPDLIIRPSGEYRLSNFMIWQAAYSEFWFSDVLWPDFTTEDFDRALADYEKRGRRFGGV